MCGYWYAYRLCVCVAALADVTVSAIRDVIVNNHALGGSAWGWGVGVESAHAAPLAGCVKCLGSDVLIMCSTCLLYCAFPDLRFITNVYGGYK